MTDIRLFSDGKQAYRHILRNIDLAKKSIYINMFIWRDDIIGNKMAKAVLAAAERGVDVTISKDRLGSVFEKAEEHKTSFFHKKGGLWLRRKGIELFYPNIGKGKCIEKPSRLSQKMSNHPKISIRKKITNDHSKFYIIDDDVILGGMNIEDRTMIGDINGVKWHDYMVELKGFARQFLARLKGEPKIMHTDVIMNRGKRFEVKQIMLDLLAKAKRSIKIEMAYFGDRQITDAIIDASRRGVDVQILLSWKTNVQPDLNLLIISRILRKAEVKAYLSHEMMHAKMMIVDDMMTFGSANINRQGMEKLSELNLLTYDKKLLKEITSVFEKRRKGCDLVTDPTKIRFNRARAICENI